MASRLYGALSSHPRNQMASRGSNVRLANGCKKIRGVTKPLRKHFYPHYRYIISRRGNSSLSIGTLAHRQLEAWATGAPPPVRPSRKKGEPPEPIPEHRFTTQFKDALKERELKPVTAEYPLLSKHGLYLTYADLLCEDADGGLVVVSLKTGYDESLIKHKSRCKGILRGLTNCSANHHWLQLACEVYTLMYEYKIPVKHAFVLYAGYGRTRSTMGLPLPAWGYSQSYMRRVHYVMAKDSPIKVARMSHIP